MAVTMELIKELRARTGIGMMECKKALEATGGDIETAIEELRKKGLAKAAKKADREALEGGIKVISEGGKAYVISVSCETDFLANSDKFKAMLEVIANYLKDNGADSKEAAQKLIESDYALEMGENLQVKDYEILEGGEVSDYVHSNGKLAAVVVADAGADAGKPKTSCYAYYCCESWIPFTRRNFWWNRRKRKTNPTRYHEKWPKHGK